VNTHIYIYIYISTFTAGYVNVRIHRGRKFKDEEASKTTKANHTKDINKNYLHENEIYEKVDPNNDPDLLQLLKEKKHFFERLDCRFGSPHDLAHETHFRSYKEARILTKGDRDIIIKRLTEEVFCFVFRYYSLFFIVVETNNSI
jgi:SNF2 family DNA or RNA helicase